MAKRRRSKRKSKLAEPGASAAARSRRHLMVRIEALEITRGHDGLMRGKPEPALLLAAYRLEPGAALGASLVGRVLHRSKVRQAPPCVLPVDGAELRYDTRLRGEERFLLLGLALEEDSGAGVAALYGRLEAPEALQLWSLTEAVPAPRPLREWAGALSLAPQGVPVELLVEERHARELSAGDEFVSACAVCVTAHDRQDEVWRLPFSEGGSRNHWTATVRVRIA